MFRYRGLAFGLILSLSLGLFWVWKWTQQTRNLKDDMLATEMRELAGPTAVDCGHVASGDDRSATDACVLASYKAKKPFQARYGPYRRNSRVHPLGHEALLGTPEGQIYLLNYDIHPDGLAIDKIITLRCVNPVIVSKNGKHRLECKFN